MADDKEHARETHEAIVVSTYPDVCRSPVAPVPYSIVGRFKTSSGLAQSVRATEQCTFTEASRIDGVVGDEGGTGKGVKSGTHAQGGVCTPVEWTPSVRAEGQRIVRHDDRFDMNNKNTQGKAVYPDGGGPGAKVKEDGKPDRDTNPEPRPETPQEKGYWQRFKDWAADVRARPGVYAGGAMQMAGGVGEIGFGAALAPETAGLGAVFMVHGADRFATGWRQFVSGVPQQTATETWFRGAGTALTGNERFGHALGKAVDQSLGGPSMTKSATDKAGTVIEQGTRITKKVAEKMKGPPPPPQPMSRGAFPDTW